MNRIAIIASTAVSYHELLSEPEKQQIDTPAGIVHLYYGCNGDTEIAFLTRSSGYTGIPSHLVNYKANILAIKALGIRRVIATSVVGSLTPAIPVGSLVILDQFLDFTRARDITLFDEKGFAQVDVTDPYCKDLRQVLATSALTYCDVEHVRIHSCYVGNDGPRFQTRAEVEMFRRLGGDVVGQTNLPEVVMAREAGFCYASLGIVSNLAAGLASHVNRREQQQIVRKQGSLLCKVLLAAVNGVSASASCDCAHAADDFQKPTPLV